MFALGTLRESRFAYCRRKACECTTVRGWQARLGAIHTYVELYARLLVDLVPNVVSSGREQADARRQRFIRGQKRSTTSYVEEAASTMESSSCSEPDRDNYRESTYQLRG